jgi:hypothetical protein
VPCKSASIALTRPGHERSVASTVSNLPGEQAILRQATTAVGGAIAIATGVRAAALPAGADEVIR